MFTVNRVFPGVAHITDAMGVSMTLIGGEEEALLFDAGYGTEDVRAFAGTLTDRPVRLLLSHGHHDHILGARWFESCSLCREDLEEYRLRTGAAQREAVKGQAEGKGLSVPEDFLTAPVPDPDPIRFDGTLGPFECREETAGRPGVLAVHVPGHTPGSVVLYVSEYDLLLTGDNWNPCTWMWFPSSVAATLWRENMKLLIRALEEKSGRKIRHVLCSHQPMLRDADELKEFLGWASDERLKAAEPADMGSPVHTRALRDADRDWTLIFDRDKLPERLFS